MNVPGVLNTQVAIVLPAVRMTLLAAGVDESSRFSAVRSEAETVAGFSGSLNVIEIACRVSNSSAMAC